jgi:DNA-binding NtrC family response regulator
MTLMTAAGTARKHRIMVVEDDQAHRNALERHLGRSGFDVLACESGEQALSRFATFAPDLVISDIRMGGMSGMDLLETLMERAPGTKIILATAYDDMQVAVDAMKFGAVDFLMKPLDLDDLDETIAKALPKRNPEPAPEPSDTSLSDRNLVGRDPQMVAIYKVIGKVAGTETPMLIRGETGTGKELVARTIHDNSRRRGQPFICVNCAALPEPLLESELFGHLKGSFTGATSDRRGRFELASEGTILLDEIGDTSAAFQAKLLRVLQEKEFYPVGGETPRRTNARVIAATHRNIEEMTRTGGFRQDLYFRLRVVELVVPPLRERRGDIPRLARHLAAKGRQPGPARARAQRLGHGRAAQLRLARQRARAREHHHARRGAGAGQRAARRGFLVRSRYRPRNGHAGRHAGGASSAGGHGARLRTARPGADRRPQVEDCRDPQGLARAARPHHRQARVDGRVLLRAAASGNRGIGTGCRCPSSFKRVGFEPDRVPFCSDVRQSGCCGPRQFWSRRTRSN